MYSAFSEEELPAEKQVREILLSYVNDYCQDMVETRIREGVDPKEDFAVNIIMKSDLNDLRYLYRFGEYISESQLETARFLNSMSQEVNRQYGRYLYRRVPYGLCYRQKRYQEEEDSKYPL